MSTSRTAPRITICGIPELGEHSAGVTHVLSILGPNSPDPPEFAPFAPHRRLILRFHDVIEPQPDQLAPTREDVERLLVLGRVAAIQPCQGKGSSCPRLWENARDEAAEGVCFPARQLACRIDRLARAA